MSNPRLHSPAYKRPESVLVVVFTRGGKVLLLKRADHPNFWQSVTGSMQWQEQQPIQTALRELREETGLKGDGAIGDMGKTYHYKILPQWRHRYAPGVVENTEYGFFLELPGETEVTLNSSEHSEYMWLDFDEAANTVASWSNRDAVLYVKKLSRSGELDSYRAGLRAI